MSLFGWREKRRIEDLQSRVERLVEQRDDARKLAGIHQGNLVRMAQAHAALHDENTQLRKETAASSSQAEARASIAQDRGNALGRLGNRLANLETEYDHIDGYAALMGMRLDRALRACARYRREVAAPRPVSQEMASLRRQLAAAHKQLDDATGDGDRGMPAARPHPDPEPARPGEVTT